MMLTILLCNFETLLMWAVDVKSVGQSKAKCVCSFLQELNDAVKAKFVEEFPEDLIERNPSFFKQFTLVIATQVGHMTLNDISILLWLL